MAQTYHEYEERERREEEFRDTLDRRYRDNPAFWHWYEARRAARLADSKRIKEMAAREAWDRDRRSQEAADLDFRIATDAAANAEENKSSKPERNAKHEQ